MLLIKLTYILFLLFEPKQVDLPIANQKVIECVNNNIGKKVDKGECWDLANKALEYAGAKWEFPTTYGKPINYLTENMLPGDLVQFENAKFELKTETSIQKWTKMVHTAIIYKVDDKLNVVLAEQNNNGIKKVALNPIDFGNLKSGRIFVYRPQLQP
jgi:hypothetical protein